MAQLILKRDGKQHQFEMTGSTTTIGRQPDCSIQLLAEGISRKHTQIVKDGDEYFLEDLDSENGTFVNGKRVQGSVQLQHKDRIMICSLMLAVDLEHQSEPGAAVDAPAAPAAESEQPIENFDATVKGLGKKLDPTAKAALDAAIAARKASGRG